MHTHTRTVPTSGPLLAPPEAVPHSVICSSASLGWHGIIVWRRHSPPTTLELPPLTMHDVVVQFNAESRLRQERSGCCHEGPWRRGDILLLPAGRPSRWDIGGAINNLHLSLDPHFVQHIAHDACEMPPEQVELRDVFTGRDLQIVALGHQLLRELTTAGGGRLYAESLATLLAIHLLRTYSTRAAAPAPREGRAATTRFAAGAGVY